MSDYNMPEELKQVAEKYKGILRKELIKEGLIPKPEEAIKEMIKKDEEVSLRVFVLNNTPTHIKADMETIDHVEQSIQKCIDIWTFDKPFEEADEFTKLIVQGKWLTVKKKFQSSELNDDINYVFVETFKNYIYTMVPTNLIRFFQKNYHHE